MNRLSSYQHQTGISIVEIMIALTLSLVLTSGVIQVFIGSKQTYRMQEAMARLQENGRFALDVISRDVRMADFWGCLDAGLADVTNNLDTTSGNYDADLHAFDKGLDGTNGTENANPALDLPDSLKLGGAAGSGINVQAPFMPNVSSNIKVSDGSGLQENDIVFLSDCASGDIFQITNNPSTGSGVDDQVDHNTGTVSAGPGNDSPAGCGACLSKTYAGDAQIYRLQATQYTIGNDSNTGEPALFRQTNTLNEELVEGIENMQILYGEDTDGDGVPNYFVPADDVTNMVRVIAVRISLLLRTVEDNISSQPLSYSYNGGTATPADRRIRRAFTATIAIRNRLS